MNLAFLSVAPLFLAVFVLVARRQLPRIPTAWIVTGVVTLIFAGLTTYVSVINSAEVVEVSVPWVPALGLSLSLYLDGLSLLFALIIVGVGAVVALYAGYYFEEALELNRFYVLLLAFMSAMLALVLAGNILTLFIAWELTSVISFLLIGFNGNKSEEARSGALQALMITGGGGLALLVGLVLLGTAAGSTELSQIITNTALKDHPWYSALAVLILIGCFSKSAQWPLHFWLPGAMSAPTPASAYLHSATMVKAGIYLLLRLYPVVGGTALWQNGLLAVGLITMLVGAVLALQQRDLKAALAYSTISQLGTAVALIGLPDGKGLEAALVAILAHSMYKAALFLMAGAVDHAAGTRDMSKLGGLARKMPGWALVTVLALLSMAGLPPLLGFVAKETLLNAMLTNALGLVIAVSSATMTVTLAFILFWDVFVGAYRGSPLSGNRHVHTLPPGMLVGPTLLVGASLVAGLRLDWLVAPLIDPIIHEDVHLALFSGVNAPLLLSVMAIWTGGSFFIGRSLWRNAQLALPSGAYVYRSLVRGLEKAGDLVLRTQNGKLRYYLVIILLAVIGLQATAGFTHIMGKPLTWMWNLETDVMRGLLLLLTLGSVATSIVFKRHLMAALMLGLSGYCVGGLFLLEPAPDVALVQFMVETLGTVLLIIMLSKISAPERESAMHNLWVQSRKGLLRDGLIATVIGTGVGLFAIAAINNRAESFQTAHIITNWHLDNALLLLGFPDVVGAIVTDFRGMDTIIEITVFSVAALGVLTLFSKPAPASPKRMFIPKHPFRALRLLSKKMMQHGLKLHWTPAVKERVDLPRDNLPAGSQFSTPLTRIISNLVLPCALLVALSQLLYGGDGPGDGFTAGVISGLGVALWYVVFGYQETKRRLVWLKARYLLGSGLALVIFNALLPMFGGLPFLRHISFDQLVLPANLHISTTLFYETGIFLTVLGCVSTVMEAIAYPQEVEAL